MVFAAAQPCAAPAEMGAPSGAWSVHDLERQAGCATAFFESIVVSKNMATNSFEMCTTNVRQHAQTGALLLDVRERREALALAFDAPEVAHIPFRELERRWQELPQDRELVTVCQNGEKSALASQFLREKGFTHVSSMRGGILLWMQKGYPVIGKRFEALADNTASTNAFDKDQAP